MKRRHVFNSNARIYLKSNVFIVLKKVIVLLASVVCVYKLGSARLEYTGSGSVNLDVSHSLHVKQNKLI